MEKHEKAAREKARATALRAAQILDSKKGSGITLIELTDETIITDYFGIFRQVPVSRLNFLEQ